MPVIANYHPTVSPTVTLRYYLHSLQHLVGNIDSLLICRLHKQVLFCVANEISMGGGAAVNIYSTINQSVTGKHQLIVAFCCREN